MNETAFFKSGTYFQHRSNIIATRCCVDDDDKYNLEIYFKGFSTPMVKRWDKYSEFQKFTDAFFTWLSYGKYTGMESE